MTVRTIKLHTISRISNHQQGNPKFCPCTTCYYGCEILSTSVPSRASNNKMVRNRVSNSGNLFHLVKHHSISRNLYKKTMNMNRTMVFVVIITNYRKYEQVGVKTNN